MITNTLLSTQARKVAESHPREAWWRTVGGMKFIRFWCSVVDTRPDKMNMFSCFGFHSPILQGKAEIIPIFEPGKKEPEDIKAKWTGCNEDKPIKFLICAPTMRVPQDVSDTCNAYLAFRGIILAGNVLKLVTHLLFKSGKFLFFLETQIFVLLQLMSTTRTQRMSP